MPAAPLHATMSRPGLLAALGLALGHVFTAPLGWPPHWWLAALLLAGAVGVALGARHALFAAAFTACLACAGGWQEQRSLDREHEGFALLEQVADGAADLSEVRGTVALHPRKSATTWTLLLDAGCEVAVRGRTLTLPAVLAVKARRDEQTDAVFADMVPGDGLHALGPLLELPRARLAEDLDMGLRTRGAVALLRARVIRAAEPRDSAAPNVMRASRRSANAIERYLTANASESSAALLTAMTLGRTHLLSDGQRVMFRRLGLMHIFAVSGLHAMLVGGMLLFFLRVVGIGARLRFPLVVVLLLLFAALVDLRSSVLRAVFLLMAWEGQDLLRRPIEPLGALGTIAAAMMLADPLAVWQLDFQMTFLAAAALILLSPWLFDLQRVLGRRLGWSTASVLAIRLAQLAAASAVIQLMLTPLLLSHFGEVSIIAPLANMFFLPVLAVVVKLAFLDYGLGLLAPDAAVLLLRVLEWPLELVQWLGWSIGHAPGAVHRGTAWAGALVGIFYIVLVSGAWNRARPATAPRQGGGRYVVSAAALAAFLLWLPVRWSGEAALAVHFLDVGQGDAILLVDATGAAALIDAGPPTAAWALPGLLLRRGIEELEFAVATHADADHIGGMDELLAEVPCRRLYVGGSIADTEEFREVARTVAEQSLPVSTLRRGAKLVLGHTMLAVLHPTDSFAGEGARNDASVVLMVEAAGTRLLLTGDAEEAAEADLLASGAALGARVVQAAHHGSSSSSSAAFLGAVRPEVAVISCGRRNRYGHPHGAVLERLAAVGAAVWRTDLDGTVTVEVRPGGGLHVRTTRGGAGNFFVNGR